MEKSQIDRINALSRIARERALTDEEERERHELRQNYLQAFRARFRTQLENTVVEYPDGARVPLKDAGRKPDQ